MLKPSQLAGQFIIVAAAQFYEVLFPGGGWRQQLTDDWLQHTVPHQYDRLMALLKDNEAPGPYWNALNFTGQWDVVDYPSAIWGGVSACSARVMGDGARPADVGRRWALSGLMV